MRAKETCASVRRDRREREGGVGGNQTSREALFLPRSLLIARGGVGGMCDRTCVFSDQTFSCDQLRRDYTCSVLNFLGCDCSGCCYEVLPPPLPPTPPPMMPSASPRPPSPPAPPSPPPAPAGISGPLPIDDPACGLLIWINPVFGEQQANCHQVRAPHSRNLREP